MFKGPLRSLQIEKLVSHKDFIRHLGDYTVTDNQIKFWSNIITAPLSASAYFCFMFLLNEVLCTLLWK